jgi:hypothetical protein
MQRIPMILSGAMLAALSVLTSAPSARAATPGPQLGQTSQGNQSAVAARRAARKAAAARGTKATQTIAIHSVNAGAATPAGIQHDLHSRVPRPLRKGNPFGLQGAVLTEVNEVMYSAPSTSVSSPNGYTQFRDDWSAGNGVLSGGLANLRQVRSAMSGNIDDDPEEEIVVVEFLQTPNDVVRLSSFERASDGTYGWNILFEVPHVGSAATYYGDAFLELGDFDGDLRDEIVLVLRNKGFNRTGSESWIRVFDDPQAGGSVMLDYERTAEHSGMWGHPADFDGDGIDELVVALEGNTTDDDRFSVRVYRGGLNESTLVLEQPYIRLFTPTSAIDTFAGRAVIGDFDGDGSDEIAYVGLQGLHVEYLSVINLPDVFLAQQFQVKLFDYSSEGGVSSLASDSDHVIDFVDHYVDFPVANGWSWDVTAFDRYGVGWDALGLLYPGPNKYELLISERNPDSLAWSDANLLTGIDADQQDAATLRAADDDGDGAEELYPGVIGEDPTSTSWERIMFYGIFRASAPGPIQQSMRIAGPLQMGTPMPPVVVPAELDADGFALRYTGVNGTSISDPIPLVLLSAAPTKSGISQNYNSTSTSYSTGGTNGVSIGVSNGAAWSTSVGSSADLGLGIEASAKATVGKSLQRTRTVTELTTHVVDYSGAHDDDTIIFQTNKYDTYEYEIIAAPDDTLVGELITLGVPRTADAYKWTVDYYNASVAPQFQIGPDLLPHTLGDPESYRSLAQLQPILDQYISWQSPAALPVGQGGGEGGMSISLQTENATAVERTISAGGEVEFKAGVSVGESYEATETDLFAISISQETVYSAQVGDIAHTGEYEDWDYKWGLAVYQAGRSLDVNGQVVWEPGARPLTVLAFWTQLEGLQY